MIRITGLTCIGMSTILFAAFMTVGCRPEPGHSDDAHDHDEAVGGGARIQPTPTGVPVLSLDEAAQTRMGVRTAPATRTNLPAASKAYGRALDPAPFVSDVLNLETARTALESAERELQRTRLLFDQDQNAPRRALEAAETEARLARVGRDAAVAGLVSKWGDAFAARSNLVLFAEDLAHRRQVLIRLELPAGEFLESPRGARLQTLAEDGEDIPAKPIGGAMNVDWNSQGQAWLFLADNRDGRIQPGQALLGFIETAGSSREGLLVPASAIVRARGEAWVYVQISGQSFRRVLIQLTHPLDGGWFVERDGVPDLPLVVTGAQLLFSEEVKGQLELED